MFKEIKTIDEKRGVMQITTVDERWYSRPSIESATQLPVFEFVPSATWISSCYPKGIAYFKWLAEHGWDESQEIMRSAGERGSKVHQAIDYLEENGKLPIDMCMTNPNTGQAEPFTTDELDRIMSFVNWHKKTNPKLIAKELVVFGDNYAGTLDRIYWIYGRIWIVDFKTSQHIWESHRLQVSAYSHAVVPVEVLSAASVTVESWTNRGLAILMLGYYMNKNRYRFVEIDDKFEMFQVAYKIWQNENENEKPKQREFPLILTLNKEESHGSIKRSIEEK